MLYAITRYLAGDGASASIALDLAPTADPGNTLALAAARVRARELEGACRAATEAGGIAQKVASERLRTRLVDFRRLAAPHANA